MSAGPDPELPAGSVAVAAEPFMVMAKPAGPQCNLDCSYCYYLEKESLFPEESRFRMSDETLRSYISSFIASSPGPIVHFGWHGGEPTMAGLDFYRKVVALQEELLPPGWTALNNLQTNGTLLDDRWGSFLARHRFSVGLSVDGPAFTHDASRPDKTGRPSHERAMRGLRVLRAHGIDPDVLCTLNSVTAAHPDEVYDFFLAESVKWVQFLPVVKRERDGSASPLSVTPRAMADFLNHIFDRWVRSDVGRIGVQNFLESLLVFSGRPANLCVMSETCGRVLAMEHDGSVYSCDHFVLPSHRLGALPDDGLGAMVESLAQASFGLSKKESLTAYCRSCPYLFACNGGCPKDRTAVSPDGEPGHNELCEGYRAFFEHIDPYLRRMVEIMRRGGQITSIMGELSRGEGGGVPVVGRNDPCPCGSGKKYKNCHLRLRS